MVVAVLDGCDRVVDDLFVELVLVFAALIIGSPEAIAELKKGASARRALSELSFVAYHGNLIPVTQLEVRDVLGLFGVGPRSIGLEFSGLRVHLDFLTVAGRRAEFCQESKQLGCQDRNYLSIRTDSALRLGRQPLGANAKGLGPHISHSGPGMRRGLSS
jgi:hypothetical protein